MDIFVVPEGILITHANIHLTFYITSSTLCGIERGEMSGCRSGTLEGSVYFVPNPVEGCCLLYTSDAATMAVV